MTSEHHGKKRDLPCESSTSLMYDLSHFGSTSDCLR